VVVILVASVSALAGLVATDQLVAGLERGLADPVGLMVVALSLLAAFSVRAMVWSRLVPGLSLSHSLAAIHVALGGNHLLPLRLGEPLRIVSAVTRSGIDMGTATASTVLLRSADMVTLVALGLISGPSIMAGHLGLWGTAVVVAIVTVAAVAIRHLIRRSPAVTRLPGPGAVALVIGAWLFESVVVWQVLRWFGIQLTAQQAVLVLAVAVSAQLLAVTPAGVGTYEAAATAALVAVGTQVEIALTAAVGLHLIKTAYSLVAGAVGVVMPRPSMLGRLRMTLPPWAVPAAAPGPGPVVLFLPGLNESATVASVIDRVPATITAGGLTRPVEVFLVDDGSSDDTASVARRAGATVVSHDANRGLGAAVRTGLGLAADRDAAAIAFCDADGEYDPTELGRLVEPILVGESHYVVGSRFDGTIERMLPHRRLGNRVLTSWVRYVTRTPVTDGQSGYRALSRQAADTADIAHDYNYAQVLTIDLLSKGFGYREVPISYAFRRTGRSFVRLTHYLRHVVPAVWRQLNAATQPFEPTTSVPRRL
jgi:uncharacterized membrane protein YbhN (UPF0104 family)